MKQFVYAVVRPAHNYEESEAFFFACLTQGQAEQCVNEINGFIHRLAARLPVVPDHVDDPAFDEQYERQESMLKKTRWPFGIDLRFDISHAMYERSIVEVRPLLIRSPRVKE